MDYKVSIIVPMYNAERYIGACVEGLLHQTLPEVEVVVVDDCSTDGSLSLCRSLFGDNERVQILAQERNGGPGIARNTGIQAARGEYIGFVDSDDALKDDACEVMYQLAAEKKADVIHTTGLNVPLVDGDPPDLHTVDGKDILYLPGEAAGYRATEIEVLPDDLQERYEKWRKRAYHWNLGTKMIRRQFLLDHDLHFGQMRLSEDMAFCFGCLFHAKTYVRMPVSFYLYRVGNVSISRRKYTPEFLLTSMKSVLDVCNMVRAMMDRMPFFPEHPKERQGVVDYFLEILLKEFVAPMYQELGEEELLREGSLQKFFAERFGESADCVLALFLALLRTYPAVPSSTSMLNLQFLREKREVIEQRIQAGLL